MGRGDRGRPAYGAAPGAHFQPAAPGPGIPYNENRLKRFLIHDQDGDGRIRVYQDRAAVYLKQQLSVIVLVPDKDAIERMRAAMESRFLGQVCVLVREGTQEILQWLHIRDTHPVLVIGTRSAVFAPVTNLGCIMIDDEHDYSYKQDQSPHYHAREIAMMRCDIEQADFIAGSAAPSLELMQAVASGSIELETVARSRPYPQVKIVDMKNLPLVSTRQKITISGYLQDAILAALAAKQKVLLFLNRKGYATLAICSHCGKIFQCPRCNVNLNFHYEAKLLRCHYCNYTLRRRTFALNAMPDMSAFWAPEPKSSKASCPGYSRRRGSSAGNRGCRWTMRRRTSSSRRRRRSGTCSSVSIWSACSGSTMRSIMWISGHAEKTFGIITCLAGLADKQIVVQTNMANHHVLSALTQHAADIFYSEEFRQRKQLLFPPYRHFVFIKFRGKVEEKVKKAAEAAFEGLSGATKPAGLSLIAVNPAQQAKLRGNYHWVILVACKDVGRLHDFLKKNLAIMRHSGIIVTVDVDPV